MRGRKPNLTVIDGSKADRKQPPSWMARDAKAEWRRVMPILRKRRILTEADLGSLENYCVAIGQVRECDRILQGEGLVVSTDKGPRKHPAVAIQSDAMTRARLLAAELGLTPVCRSRPTVKPEDEHDEDDLADLDL